MPIKNISKRERSLGGITLLLAVLFVTYNFVLEPMVTRWKTLNKEIYSKKIKLTKDIALLKRSKILEREYKGYPDLRVADKSEEEEITTAFGEIERISNKSSCYILNIKPRTSRKRGDYKEISFDVTVSGVITEIARFLYEIETSKEYLRIRRYTITTRSGSSSKLKGVFRISKMIFV